MDPLLLAAIDVRTNAYAPYSGYTVGAAIETEEGEVFLGANVENVSYGVTLCAERAAIGAMASAGARRIRRIALSTRDGGTPCGMCLQALLEFAPDPSQVEVTVFADSSAGQTYRLSDLLPHAFASANVKRTERTGS